MKPEDQAWQRLVAAARAARDDRDTAAPYGFATRVAALAMAAEARPARGLFERLAWRALGIAALLAVASVAASYSGFGSTSADEDLLADPGAVTAVFDLS